jgi:hypothetical protein
MKFLMTNEFVSLNDCVYTEFSIQELELRLETDPLLFTDFFQQSIMQDDIVCSAPDSLVLCSGGGTLNVCDCAPEAQIVRS